ncbi:hypothetical protein [Euzebya tangerina]|uniref:hypothetical protein n=1 Tax=Euzebya tangerina TaxID=591198 RepID=UPI000E317CA6|nr:hypothetical protein [Euzebya tangerina]
MLRTSVVELASPRVVHIEGEDVLLLTYDQIGREARSLECATAPLRQVVDNAQAADVVAFVPDHIVEPDLTPMLTAGCKQLTEFTVAAFYAPVTDAVKEIKGGVVTGPVDRSTLAWVRGPAFVPRDLLWHALMALPTPTVRPLTVASSIVDDFTIGRL